MPDRLSLWTTLAVLVTARLAAGEVVFDGSMGPAGAAPTRTSPGFTTDYLVTYDERVAEPDRQGELRGSNLFQSLSVLDLLPDQRATLQALDGAGAPLGGVERLVVRVTNGAPSLIEGVLRSEVTGADLFLLNPAGIVFLGQGGIRRQLDVPAGFTASTADVLHFEDGNTLPVGDPAAAFSLSSAPVESYGFLPGANGEVRFDQTLPFEVSAGHTLTVVAGDVVLDGISTVQAPGGTLQIAAVGEAGAEVPVDLADWSVQGAALGSLGEIAVLGFSTAQALAPARPQDPQGRIVLRGGRLVVDDSAVVAGGNAGPQELAIDAEFADEIVSSTDSRIQVTGSRAVGLGSARLAAPRIEIGDPGTFVGARPVSSSGGPFMVEADELVVRDFAVLGTEAIRGARGSDLLIDAQLIEVRGDGRIESSTRVGDGTGGKLVLEAERIEIAEGGDGLASVRSFSEDGGSGGDVEIRASELVLRPRARVETIAGGANGGSVLVNVDVLELDGGAQIRATTSGDRDAGDVHVTASERISIRGDDPVQPAGLFARSGENAVMAGAGAGGNLDVSAPVIEISGQAALSTRSFGVGDPGALTVRALDRLVLHGTAAGVPEISARVQDGSTGGAMEITAGSIELLGGAAISSATLGRAPGGTISIDAANLLVSGANQAGVPSAINSDSASLLPDAGNAGAIAIHVGDGVRVTAGAEIAARSRGSGDAGSIAIEAGEVVTVENGGLVTATALFSDGEAGNVAISAPHIVLDAGTVATEAANGSADGIGAPIGGNIRIDAGSDVRMTNGSRVSARSVGSQDAGRIAIDAGRGLLVVNSEITSEATEQTANAGGGQIDLTATERVDLVDSRVTTSVRAFEGNRDAGNITIDPRFVVVNESQILAQAIFGDGGNIRIVAENYLQSAGSVVDASSALGIDGTVAVEGPENQLKGQLARLPERYLESAALLRAHCAARAAETGSFVLAGSEGVAAAPDAPLSGTMPLPSAPSTPRALDGDGAGSTVAYAIEPLDCASYRLALESRQDGR